jgi:uncharacterized protein (DUF1330 family)
MPETPVVNCVLLWAVPGMEAALSAYEDEVLRLVAEHGGRVLERGTVLPGSQYDGEPPAEVQFLEMPSEASLDAYVNDPRRLALAGERGAAIARMDVFRIQRVLGQRDLADLDGGSGCRVSGSAAVRMRCTVPGPAGEVCPGCV